MLAAAMLVVVAVVLILLPGLDRQVMVRQQELRVTLTARNMVESGNWLIPEFQGEARLQKPPLMYWITGAAYMIFNTMRSAFVARLPSVLAVALAAGLIFYAGGWAQGRRYGLWSVLIFTSTFVFHRYARLGETDTTLMLFTAVSVLAGYRAIERDAHTGSTLLAGLGMALGFMTKGPAAVAVPLLVLGAYTVTRRPLPWRAWLKVAVVAVAITTLVALPWYVYVVTRDAVATEAEMAVAGELDRLVDSGSHPGPWYYYLYVLPEVLLPWGILFPFALVHAIRRGRRRGLQRLALIWLCAGFVLLSVIHQKQEHYTLLIVVPSALVIGGYLRDMADENGTQRVFRWMTGVVLVVLSAIALALPFTPLVDVVVGTGVMVWSVGVVLAVAAGWWSWKKRRVGLYTGAVWAAMAFTVYGYLFNLHALERPKSLYMPFAEVLEKQFHIEEGTIYAGDRKATLEFYLDTRFREYKTPAAAWQAASVGDLVVIAGDDGEVEELESSGPEPAFRMTRADVMCAVFIKRID